MATLQLPPQEFDPLSGPLIAPGLKPIDPNARAAIGGFIEPTTQDAGGAKLIDLTARETLGGAEFDDAPPEADLGTEFDDAPPEADPANQFDTVDDLDARTIPELNKDRVGFDPVSYFSDNPDVANNPAKLKKLLDIRRLREEEGLTSEGILRAAKKGGPELAKGFVPAAKQVVENIVDVAVQPIVNFTLGALTGDLQNLQTRKALFAGPKKSLGELSAAAEATATGAVDLARQAKRKIEQERSKPEPPGLFAKPRDPSLAPALFPKKQPRPLTDQEILAGLSDDVEFRKNAADILGGSGEGAKLVHLDAETLAKEGITLDPKAVEAISLVEPLTMVAGAGLFKILGAGGKLIATARSVESAEKFVDGLAKFSKTAGTLKAVGKAARGAGETLAGRTPSALSIGHTIATGNVELLGAALGAKYIAAPIARKTGTALFDAGRVLAGEIPAAQASAGVNRLAALAKTGAQVAEAGKEVAKDVFGGEVKGAVAAAPFAAASYDDEQAGTLLGAGAILGGAAGAAASGGKAFRVVKNAAARESFGPNRKPIPAVDSPGYGRVPEMDEINLEQKKKLSVATANELDNFREGLRSQGREIYAVDSATFRQKAADRYKAQTGNDIDPALLDTYQKHHALFDETSPDGTKVVYLNADAGGAGALQHDAGHLFDSLLSPETVKELDAAITKAFPPEAIADFKKRYEKRVGNKISDDDALSEFRAEQFGAMFYNIPVSEMAAPKGLLRTFADVAAQGAEALGVDIVGGATTPNLQAPRTVGLRNMFESAARTVLEKGKPAPKPAAIPPVIDPAAPAPPVTPPRPSSDLGTLPADFYSTFPAPRPSPDIGTLPADFYSTFPGGPATPPAPDAPVAPAPVPPVSPVAPAPAAPASRNIRVTPEQVAAFKQTATPEIRAAAAARAAETGVDYARGEAKKLPADSPTARVIEQISDSMESGAPVVQIEHLGITSVGTPEGPIGAILRKGEREGGYAALNAAQLDVRQNAPPEIVSQHSKNFVPVRWDAQGGSPTLMAMSLDKVISNILRIVSDKTIQDLIPYPVENGKLTPQGWREVVADARSYSENQSNGRKGDGGRLEVPEAGLAIPTENPAYTPQPLTPARANFHNLVQGLATPKTSRATKGKIPGNVKAQILAEANRRPVEIPAKIPTKQASKQAFVDFSPRVVQEVNPLRNEMARRGVRVRDLLEVTERIRAKDIVSATPRPEINYKAPITDTIRGGFLPAPTEFRRKSLQGRTVSEFAQYVLEAPAAEWKAATDNMVGGLTGGAWNLGLSLKDAGDVGVLKSYQDKASTATKEAMQAGDFDKAYSLVSRAQFFREATEAAQGTGSAGAAFKRGTAGMESAKPPFPLTDTPKTAP